MNLELGGGGGVALGVLEPYRRTKADEHWVFLRWHPYRSPYQAVPGVPELLIVGELRVEGSRRLRWRVTVAGAGGRTCVLVIMGDIE